MSLLEFGLGIGVKGTGNVLPIGFARPSVEHTFRVTPKLALSSYSVGRDAIVGTVIAYLNVRNATIIGASPFTIVGNELRLAVELVDGALYWNGQPLVWSGETVVWTGTPNGSSVSSFVVPVLVGGVVDTLHVTVTVNEYMLKGTVFAGGLSGVVEGSVLLGVPPSSYNKITLSNNVVATTAFIGTTVGLLNVDGATIVGTSPFTIVGRELRVNAALTAGEYSVSVRADGYAPATIIISALATSESLLDPTPVGAAMRIIGGVISDISAIALTLTDNRDLVTTDPQAITVSPSEIAAGGGIWTRTVSAGWVLLTASITTYGQQYTVWVSLLEHSGNTVVAIDTGHFGCNMHGRLTDSAVVHNGSNPIVLGAYYDGGPSANTLRSGSQSGMNQATFVGGKMAVCDPRGFSQRETIAHFANLTSTQDGWTHSTDAGFDVLSKNLDVGAWTNTYEVRTQDAGSSLNWQVSAQQYGGWNAGYTAAGGILLAHTLAHTPLMELEDSVLLEIEDNVILEFSDA